MDLTLLEGVYMAPDPRKAAGLIKDFAESDPKNWSTLGAQYSKFTDVGNAVPEPYPYARIGFILASPVLLLNEGDRKVTIQLLCTASDTCDNKNLMIGNAQLFSELVTAMGETYVIVTKKLIAAAEKKGIHKDTITLLTG